MQKGLVINLNSDTMTKFEILNLLDGDNDDASDGDGDDSEEKKDDADTESDNG